MDRTAERQRISDAIAQLQAARERERGLDQALRRAGEIEQAAADEVDQTRRSASAFAGRMKAAALAGASAPSAVPDEVRREGVARSRLAAAQEALAEITADLEAARSATLGAVRDLDAATQSLLLAEAQKLVGAGLEMLQSLKRLGHELSALDRAGGHVGESGWRPFPFPAEGRVLVGAVAPIPAGDPALRRWQAFRDALKSDPDAQLAEAG